MSKQQLNDLDFQNVSRILNLLDPTLAQHAATKNYVDSLLQPQRITTRLTNNSNATLTSMTALQYALTAGGVYLLECFLLHQSVATTTGLTLTLSTPTGIVSGIAATSIGNDGTGTRFHGNITASGDVVTSTGVQTANTSFLAHLYAIVQPTANGNLIPQFRSEVNGSQVSIEVGSSARLMRIA